MVILYSLGIKLGLSEVKPNSQFVQGGKTLCFFDYRDNRLLFTL